MLEHEKQECIPVGCLLPAAVTICWLVSASVHAGIHPLGLGPSGVGLDTPLRYGPGHSPGQTPPLGLGLHTWPDLQTSPRVWPRHPSPPLPSSHHPPARPINLPLGVGLDTPRPQPPLSEGLDPLARPSTSPWMWT